MKAKKIFALILATALIFSFAACSGSSGKVTASLSEIYEDGSLKQYYLNNPETFMSSAQSGIEMKEADAQDFLANPDRWQLYSLDIIVSNKGKEAFSFIGFDKIASEQDGFYFSTCPINGELSLTGGSEDEAYPATVAVNTDKVSIEQMYTIISELNITLLGYPTPEDDNQIIDPKDYAHIKVKNNITAPKTDNTETSKEISAKRSSIEDGSDYLEIYRNNELIFTNEAKLYGMDADTATQAMNKEGNWQCYILNIAVQNKTDEDLTVYRIMPASNGTNGVWVNGISQYGEFSMAAGTEELMPVNVLIDTDALGGKTVEQAISEAVIELEYSKGTLMDENGNESIQIKKIAEVK